MSVMAMFQQLRKAGAMFTSVDYRERVRTL
jgi:hypothetical protein